MPPTRNNRKTRANNSSGAQAGSKHNSDNSIDPVWSNEGSDFLIVSSDDVKFYVPSYYLLAHSSVFRDAHQVADGPSSSNTDTQQSTIHLTDPTSESAEAIRIFLSAVVGKTMDDTLQQFPGFQVRALYSGFPFAKKYECDIVMQIFTQWLKTDHQASHRTVHAGRQPDYRCQFESRKPRGDDAYDFYNIYGHGLRRMAFCR
ncbi:hypothetical protein IAT40_001204 [Kwoniella sp. CBS 6097]